MFHIVILARFRRYQTGIHNKTPIRQKQLIENVRKNGWWQAWANKELSRYYGMAARHSQLTIDAHRFKPPRPVFCWVHLSVNGKHVYYRLSRTVWLLPATEKHEGPLYLTSRLALGYMNLSEKGLKAKSKADTFSASTSKA